MSGGAGGEGAGTTDMATLGASVNFTPAFSSAERAGRKTGLEAARTTSVAVAAWSCRPRPIASHSKCCSSINSMMTTVIAWVSSRALRCVI